MKQISSVDLHFLVREMSIFENQRIDNFYFDVGIFYIRVYVQGKGHRYLVNKVSKFIYMDTQKDESSQPSNFITYLRKYLRNGFIRNVAQVGDERIIRIDIEKKEGEELLNFSLYLELFANGNIILTDSEGIIKNSLEKRKFKDRDVMVHSAYTLPPPREFSYSDIDKKRLEGSVKASDLNLVKFLAIKVGLGGKFAEEVAAISGLDKNKLVRDMDEKELMSMLDAVKELKKKEIDARLVVDEKEEATDFTPFPFTSLNLNSQKVVPSFNDALRTYFSRFKEEIDKREEDFKKELRKLELRLQKLQEQKEEVEREYETLNSCGNKIYENYADIDELLKGIGKAAKEKGWSHVYETVKNNERLKKVIKKIDEKNNSIILEFK